MAEELVGILFEDQQIVYIHQHFLGLRVLILLQFLLEGIEGTDTVRAAISEARFAQAVNRMRESTTAMLDTKKLPAIVKLASSSFGITEDESNGVLEHLITGGDFSLYGLANAVTRFSQDVESYDRATKLEEIGYSVMTMSPALFRQMNQTELLAA